MGQVTYEVAQGEPTRLVVVDSAGKRREFRVVFEVDGVMETGEVDDNGEPVFDLDVNLVITAVER